MTDPDDRIDLIMMGVLMEAGIEICDQCEEDHPTIIFRTKLLHDREMYFELDIPPDVGSEKPFLELLEAMTQFSLKMRALREARQAQKQNPNPSESN